ncbi:MAG: hypothetical protein KatS3mg121_0502 [Gammaproteobacteria bacterium]|nr:MAG: hypothetical protein KatS3mg121_0502 [Gammaproteobacteria bacterium]
MDAIVVLVLAGMAAPSAFRDLPEGEPGAPCRLLLGESTITTLESHGRNRKAGQEVNIIAFFHECENGALSPMDRQRRPPNEL